MNQREREDPMFLLEGMKGHTADGIEVEFMGRVEVRTVWAVNDEILQRPRATLPRRVELTAFPNAHTGTFYTVRLPSKSVVPNMLKEALDTYATAVFTYEQYGTPKAHKILQKARERVLSIYDEALDILAHIVAQANVNPVAGDDGFIKRYDMPVGSIHKAIPFLAKHGIVVDEYGQVHRAAQESER